MTKSTSIPTDLAADYAKVKDDPRVAHRLNDVDMASTLANWATTAAADQMLARALIRECAATCN
jgi:hypothetical protein